MIPPTLDPPSFAGASDEELMERLKNRDEVALHEVRDRYGKVLRTIVGHTLVEESEADDVVQDTFLQVWTQAHRYSRQFGKPLGWIITMARRRAIDRVRRRQSYGRAMEAFEAHALETIDRGKGGHIDEQLIGSDLRRFLQSKLNSLPEKQREALELSFFLGLSHREIAVATATPLGTVKTRLELGLRKMTQHVAPLRSKI